MKQRREGRHGGWEVTNRRKSGDDTERRETQGERKSAQRERETQLQ